MLNVDDLLDCGHHVDPEKERPVKWKEKKGWGEEEREREREDRKRKGSSTQLHRLIERENYRQKEREKERFERNDSLIPHAEERRERGVGGWGNKALTGEGARCGRHKKGRDDFQFKLFFFSIFRGCDSVRMGLLDRDTCTLYRNVMWESGGRNSVSCWPCGGI